MAFIIPMVAAAASSVTAAGAMAAASMVAAGVAAAGSIQAGNAQASADRYNAQQDQIKAGEALSQGVAQSAIDQTATRRNVGLEAAAYGGAGVDSTGTPLMVMMDQTTQGAMQQQLDLYRGTTNAQADKSQSALDAASATQASTAGAIKAGSTLLTGASSAYNSYSSSPGTSPLTAGSNGRVAGPV